MNSNILFERPLDIIPSDALTVTDLKNYAHCPRIPYYEHCLPDVRPRTYAMDAGDMAHEEERQRAARRTLAAYGLDTGERHFNVRVMCPDLRLVGLLDELIVTGEVFHPVDYKLSHKISPSFAMQITAYAVLIEAHFQTRVTRGYIYLIGKRELIPVEVTPKGRAEVRAAVTAIREMARAERMPPPVRARAKCRACEFRRFCNDV